MTDQTIAYIVSTKWVPKIGKYIVKLGYQGEKAETVWMTERQLCQIESLFARTQHGHSCDRCRVIGVWNDRGYYAYARLEKTDFIAPVQYDLSDLREDVR